MSFKIPCGGFKLDEKSFSLDENGVLSVSGGGGSIPKPLTYDYMPEGYPSKSVGTVTLMEEQEVTFADSGEGVYRATAPVKIDVLDGQTYTVVWDGVEYSCVGHVTRGGSYIGNPAAFGAESTGEPFVYANLGSSIWVSYDTATSHTIKVMRQQETYTPMDANFIPNTIQRVGDDVIISSSTADSAKKFKITVDDSGAISATEVT